MKDFNTEITKNTEHTEIDGGGGQAASRDGKEVSPLVARGKGELKGHRRW